MAIDKVVDSNVLDGYFGDIATAIRNKNGSSDTYTPAQMPTAIDNIPSGGGDNLGDSIDGSLNNYTYNGSITTGNKNYQFSSINAKNLTMVPITGYTTYAFAYNQSEVINLPNATTGGRYAFYQCPNLKEVNLPLTTKLYQNQFRNCPLLETVNVPLVSEIERNCFYDATSLKEVKLPNAENTCFTDIAWIINCTNLEILDVGKNDSSTFTTIMRAVISGNSKLKHLVIRRTSMVSILYAPDSSMFGNCPLTQGTGWVYVPRAILTQYEAGTNWSTLGSGQWRALEDYTVDGTITGDLDPSLI